MFGLFKKREKKAICPVNEEMRLWIDNSIFWLINTFGEEPLKTKKILTPHYDDFPIAYNGEYQTAFDTLNIIATQMDINSEDIRLDIYAEGLNEVDTGGIGRIFMGSVDGEKYSGGLYWGKEEDGKYHIGIERNKLKNPIALIATLAHELSHIKLLGENRIDQNNEPLTDLTTVVFGLGIFNANACFQTNKGFDSWGWSKLGYLSQMEWGYALALFSHIKDEDNTEWINFLSPNVKGDFKQSERFIKENEQEIFNGKP